MAEIFSPTPIDAIAVLGHNLNLTRSVNTIRQTPGNISVESKIIAEAAGTLYMAGITKELILPTGPTAGKAYPTEAEAIDQELCKKFPRIPPEAKILKPTSLDTAGDARQSINIIRERGHKNVAVLSVGRHAQNAARLFEYYGFPIPQSLVLPAEEIVYTIHKRHDPAQAENFINDFKYFAHLSGINLREFLRGILLSTIDPGGNLLGQVTKRTRG